MRVHLVNPSDLSFGTAVITPRWLYVLAAATPRAFGDPLIVDETLEHLRSRSPVAAGRRRRHRHPHRQRAARLRRSGKHGARARRVGRLRRHPLHAVSRRGRASTAARTRWSRGDGDSIWPTVLADAPPARRSRSTRADGSKAMPSCRRAGTCCPPIDTCGARCRPCAAARSTARSVRCGDRRPEAAAARRRRRRRARSSSCGAQGFRFILLADDNFYPVTLEDLQMAKRRADKTRARRARGAARRAVRADGAARAAARATWCSTRRSPWRPPRTPSSSTRCGRRAIRGALVGVESVTPEGLKAVYKDFNLSRRRAGRRGCRRSGSTASTCWARSSSVCRPTSPRRSIATAELAQRAGVTFAQFVMLTPFPGTVDFAKWEKEGADVGRSRRRAADALLADPAVARPKVYTPHPTHVGRRDPRRHAGGLGSVLRAAADLGAVRVREVAARRAWRSC